MAKHVLKETALGEPSPGLFDASDPDIKRDIVSMIAQYLQDEGYMASCLTVQDEAEVKLMEQQNRSGVLKRMRKCVVEGDWGEVEKLTAKVQFQQPKSFLYACHRQQFLELVEDQEYQKAFTHLTKRLKPLEASAASLGEFKDLCYLLTCRSVHEVRAGPLPFRLPPGLPPPSARHAPHTHTRVLNTPTRQPHRAPHPPLPTRLQVLSDWPGAAAGREQLLVQFSTMLDFEERRQGRDRGPATAADGVDVPPARLVALLGQAAAFQVERSRSTGRRFLPVASPPPLAAEPPPGGATPSSAAATLQASAAGSKPQLSSLLRDYTSPRRPNTAHAVLCGHAGGVKCVQVPVP